MTTERVASRIRQLLCGTLGHPFLRDDNGCFICGAPCPRCGYYPLPPVPRRMR